MKIFIGGNGLVGSNLYNRLSIGHDVYTASREFLDLSNKAAVKEYFKQGFDAVVLTAAKVGGIHANNTYPVEFLVNNLNIELSTITAAFESGIKRLIFLGSTCIYPRDAHQPITEDQLLSGPLESTNEAYALAKICGVKLCEYYRRQYGVTYHSVMPTNLYGPRDNYHPENSHVLPALLRRFHENKQKEKIEVWGTGNARREFMHVYDLCDIINMILDIDNPPDIMNVGTGVDISIRELVELIADVVDYRGSIIYNSNKPDGTPRKLTDISILKSMGWDSFIPLKEGLSMTYQEFLKELSSGRLRS